MGNTRRVVAAASVVLLFGLAACSSEPAVSENAPSESATPSATPTATDLTAKVSEKLDAATAKMVQSATETEPGRVEVKTTITDPRGAEGSAEAKSAIKICQAAVDVLKASNVTEPKVYVQESDGTQFVIAGHPTYGANCTEV